MLDIMKKAKELGVKTDGLNRTEVIRSIQRKEGNFDCFGKAQNFCDQSNCAWRTECLPQPAQSPVKQEVRHTLTTSPKNLNPTPSFQKKGKTSCCPA